MLPFLLMLRCTTTKRTEGNLTTNPRSSAHIISFFWLELAVDQNGALAGLSTVGLNFIGTLPPKKQRCSGKDVCNARRRFCQSAVHVPVAFKPYSIEALWQDLSSYLRILALSNQSCDHPLLISEPWHMPQPCIRCNVNGKTSFYESL